VAVESISGRRGPIETVALLAVLPLLVMGCKKDADVSSGEHAAQVNSAEPSVIDTDSRPKAEAEPTRPKPLISKEEMGDALNKSFFDWHIRVVLSSVLAAGDFKDKQGRIRPAQFIRWKATASIVSSVDTFMCGLMAVAHVQEWESFFLVSGADDSVSDPSELTCTDNPRALVTRGFTTRDRFWTAASKNGFTFAGWPKSPTDEPRPKAQKVVAKKTARVRPRNEEEDP